MFPQLSFALALALERSQADLALALALLRAAEVATRVPEAEALLEAASTRLATMQRALGLCGDGAAP